jgi:hypothetical protein
MKNIHILPTDKPSRLIRFFTNKYYLCKEILPIQDEERYMNIYITSDEEIKDGDWMIRGNEQPTLVTPNFFWDFGVRYYKIILTTDQDLIKDGVQAISDEFLEWFVKNPSCEKVKVADYGNVLFDDKIFHVYKIIIPQEEPKQKQKESLIEIMRGDEELGIYEESKQETLEEAFKKWSGRTQVGYDKIDVLNFGAKWQAERMYSEEEVLELLQKALTHQDDGEIGSLVTVQGQIRTANFYSWFEKFKKK